MNNLILVLTILLVFSCGQPSSYILDEIKLELLKENKIIGDNYSEFIVVDSLNQIEANSVLLSFKNKYSCSSGGQKPGGLGAEDSIADFKIELIRSGKTFDLSKLLIKPNNKEIKNNLVNGNIIKLEIDSIEQIKEGYNYVYKRYKKIKQSYNPGIYDCSDLSSLNLLFNLNLKLEIGDKIETKILFNNNRELKETIII